MRVRPRSQGVIQPGTFAVGKQDINDMQLRKIVEMCAADLRMDRAEVWRTQDMLGSHWVGTVSALKGLTQFQLNALDLPFGQSAVLALAMW